MESPHLRKYFFQKGNKFGVGGGGRPPASKYQIETIRRRILTIVKRRILREKDLETVSTTDLLKFMAAVMPRDWIQMNAPQITYISSIPRDADVELAPESLPDKSQEEQPVVNIEQQPAVPQL